MTPDEQKTICKAVVQATMWGYSGIAAVTMDKLQDSLPTDPSWGSITHSVRKEAEYEAVGVVTTRAEILRYLRAGYRICNYEPGELQIHNSSIAGGGLHKYIIGDLVEEFGAEYDPHNFRVFKRRAEDAARVRGNSEAKAVQAAGEDSK